MVEDDEYANKQSDYGKMGGNPTLKGGVKPEQSRAEQKKKRAEFSAGLVESVLADFNISDGDLVRIYVELNDSRKENRQGQLTGRMIKSQVKGMKEKGLSVAEMIETINNSISNGWQGVFPDRTTSVTKKKRVENCI